MQSSPVYICRETHRGQNRLSHDQKLNHIVHRSEISHCCHMDEVGQSHFVVAFIQANQSVIAYYRLSVQPRLPTHSLTYDVLVVVNGKSLHADRTITIVCHVGKISIKVSTTVLV